MLASKKNGVLYIGVTNDLKRRMHEHQSGLVEGFTKTYNVKKLVWYDQTTEVAEAIAQEKRMKKWNREWKINLINKGNPRWLDLSEGWTV